MKQLLNGNRMPPKKKYDEMLRADIQQARFSTNEPLPSYRQLAKQYVCSIATVKRMVDTLQNEGIVVTIPGKGTFLTTGQVVPRRPKNNIIGIVTVHNQWQTYFSNYRTEWLDRGWMFAVYDAFEDQQEPRLERLFLRRAQSEGFCSIIMVPTPFSSQNTALFRKLRQEGIKIAHIAPDLADLPQESFFLLDHVAGGQLAVKAACERGYEYGIFTDISLPTAFKHLMHQGLVQQSEISGLKLLPALNISYWGEDAREGETEERRQCKLTKVAGYLDIIRSLPQRTVLFCAQSDLADICCQVLSANGIIPGRDIGVIALDCNTPGPRAVTTISYDIAAQVHAALEYATDHSISPLKAVQQYFPPAFTDYNTL